ncbi:molybdopterin cofactor-binding domain-containing protein [Ciceribacter sp. L1K22]|uniref:molybdopterin cofactor-binding domain-containing protein n=1 Tax=Ciceribacter sp. L1K22 TaxID=2820275 RepID=UPI001ABE4057|nr:molybdopterin cofactor-binding domain-containing protein [Ciceribacter sp. L1K22]MBO3762183.1 molybdopterin-dependent oxidoreductase [Ciceribacter sp. L1K22]
MRVLKPASLQEALGITSSDPDSRLIAGGTALQLEWARGLPKPSTMITLANLPELRGISQEGDSIRIGALCTLADLIGEKAIADHLPLLHSAFKIVAGPTVRNLATIGGNICGRNGCLLPALLALDAELEVATANGTERGTLAEWLAAPVVQAAVLVAIHLRPQLSRERYTFRKVGLRAAFTPSVINVAGRFRLHEGHVADPRFAVGGGVVPVTRLTEAEEMLAGADAGSIDWAALHACLLDTIAAPDDDFRSGSYRRRVAANALVHGLGGPLPPIRSIHPTTPLPQPEPLDSEIVLSRARQGNRWHIRPDMADKIRGRLGYLTDKREYGMLVGRILRAGLPHARILSIDTTAAEALSEVVAVVTHRDIAGSNAFGIVIQDQPALCHDKVRHKGDPVAAVAALDAETAEKALTLIKVEYEPLPLVDTPEAALAENAALVHDGGNLQRELFFRRGDVLVGFDTAAFVLEETYVTPRQMHGFMETEGGYAFVGSDGTLNVFVGGQHGGRDRLQLSRILAMPEEKIRVVTSPTGGAFGGKDELSVQPALALLALKSGKPVRLQLSRSESVLAGQKRNPMTIRMKTACDADGLLLAQEVEVLADAGAYASLGPGVLETALEHATGPYAVPNVSTHGRLACTNNGTCGAFRGFGANQMNYAVECQMDRLARLTGLSPTEIRARNLRSAGTPGYLGQVVSKSERIAEMLQAASASELWRKAQGTSEDGEWIIGTGMAMNYQGNGLGSVVPDPAGGRLALTSDGFIEGAYGLDEMGQGLLPLIRATVAAELGCAREDVKATFGDTALAPESGSTTASRGTYVVWESARRAAPEFSRQVRAAAGRLLDRDPDTLVFAPGGLAERGSNSGTVLVSYRELAAAIPEADLPNVTVAYEFPKTDYPTANARYIFAFGATIARVAVSRVTGQVRVLDLHQHSAAGPVMDVAAYLGQLEGGAVQGLGFTLTEDTPMRDGGYLTANLDTYMLPGIQDTPETMRIFALEGLDADDDLGPRGSGELGIGAVTPAIANAVASAIGYSPAVTPVPPEAILEALAVRA